MAAQCSGYSVPAYDPGFSGCAEIGTVIRPFLDPQQRKVNFLFETLGMQYPATVQPPAGGFSRHCILAQYPKSACGQSLQSVNSLRLQVCITAQDHHKPGEHDDAFCNAGDADAPPDPIQPQYCGAEEYSQRDAGGVPDDTGQRGRCLLYTSDAADEL